MVGLGSNAILSLLNNKKPLTSGTNRIGAVSFLAAKETTQLLQSPIQQ
jgi:hypothetical protein